MKAMEHLAAEGKIQHIGVSNFSVRQTREAQEVLSKSSLVSNQVEYSLLDRSIETGLLPYAEREHITIIAYSPIAKGEILQGRRGRRWQTLDKIASKYNKTRAQVALNWLIAKKPVVAIPKAASLNHVRENAGAAGWQMSKQDHDKLSEAFD
jgi:diketogulonate reductase-like aldo/keto reductase